MEKKLFDFAIGNPPYQENTQNKGDRSNPVYNEFMDATYGIASKVELITPARFLFEAGQTPKAWNEKMLKDEHFKVLNYEPNATKVFPNTDIKGGVAITYRDDSHTFGAIETFTAFYELNSIIKKVSRIEGKNPRLNTIIASQGLYRFTNKLFEDHKEINGFLGAGTGNKIVSSIMEKALDVFKNEEFDGCVKLLGRIKGKREYRYVRREYIIENNYIDTYNLLLPEANNSGHFGEVLTEPIIGEPGTGAADTFLSAGQFATRREPENFSKYLKTKFFRALLGVKKVTQHCPPKVWELIPIQNFKDSSDIDWSKSIHEIDLQLYKKYGLTDDEIQFIETNVKEMV